MDTKGHMLLSSTCTTGKVWGHKFYDTAKAGKVCAAQKVQKTQFEKQIFEPEVQQMEFVSMDLIGGYHPPHQKVIDWGTNWGVYAYRIHLLHTHQEQISRRNSDRPGEIISPFHLVFAGNYWWTMALSLKMNCFPESQNSSRVERKIYSPPYRPQSNGRIEGFHKFLKNCLAKHICEAHRMGQCCATSNSIIQLVTKPALKGITFLMFVMFGRDAVTNLSQLTKPKLRYRGFNFRPWINV